jgi:hypothetical protein
MAIRKLQTAEAIPTGPSSVRIRSTETIKMTFTKRNNPSTPDDIRIALDGSVKNSSDTSKMPPVSVVKAKSKKPDPRVYKPGGETNIETSNNVHQTKFMAQNISVNDRSTRTVQRL